MHTTADGYPLNIGDTVWVRSNVMCTHRPPSEHVVGDILERKILYANPDPDDYIGARLSVVFHLKDNAYWTSNMIEREL